ncbi:MAG: sugar-transfer associated ATP-grasp domain-containing protein [Gemmatimonadota bacterium]
MRAIEWLDAVKRQATDARDASGVPIRTQLRQIAEVGYVQGVGRAEYFKYRLWRPDLASADRMSYTSQRERRHSEQLTNPRRPGEVERSKSALIDRLERAGLPTPSLLMRVWAGPADGGAAGDVTSPAELAERLSDVPSGGVVFKPEYGMQGNAILVAPTASREGIVLLSGRSLEMSELWHYLGERGPGWRVEQWIDPHPRLRALRPGATPTLRLLTLRFPEQVIVHAATLKVPRGDSGVDNLAKGNLVAAVDLASGRVGPAFEGNGRISHVRHPESGVSIEGEIIPHWDAVLEAGRRGARTMDDSRALGWDVAVTAAGPVIIEPNRHWCEKVVQLPADRGIIHGAFIRLLHEVGGAGLLARRRRWSKHWAALERAALTPPSTP